MKKLFLTVILSVTISMFLFGCGGHSYKGSDEDVKKLVLKIAREEFRNQLSVSIYKQLTNVPVEIIGMDARYEPLKRKAAKDSHAKKAINKVNVAMSRVKFLLTNIRTNKIEKDIKKSYNSATLEVIFDGKRLSHDIDYTAQVTDDGKLYVEIVKGL